MRMKYAKWIATIFLLIVLLASNQVNAQKRRKGDKKKEAEVTTVKNDVKSEGGGKQRGRTTPTTTTTTTAPTTPIIVEDLELEEDIGLGNLPTLVGDGVCPPELKATTGKTIPCTCIDELEDNALMIECVALTSAQDMHLIFQTYLLGKRIEAIEVRNSTLGSLVAGITAQAHSSTVMMRGNQITELVPDSFRGTDQIVGRLDLSSNQLTRVNFSIFDSFTQLQVMNLGENQLTNIEDAGAAPSLRVLYLYSNKIDTIEPRAFRHLSGLEYLDLRWNNLQVLSANALEVSSTRWQLRIRSNQIATLENAFSEEHLPYLIDLSLNNIGVLTDTVYGPLIESAILEGSKIYFGGNAIQCNCSIAWLVKNARLLAAVVGARCDGDGMHIADLSLDEFRKCPPPKPWYSPLDRALAELAREVEV